MQIELTRSFVEYQAQSRLLELGVEIAESKSLNKPEVNEKLSLNTKIRLWLKALQYYAYLEKSTIDKLVYCLADLCDANAIPYAPVITTVEPPTILVGIKGDTGDTGAEGPEGGGVPFSSTNVTIDSIIDQFPVTDSRGVEYTINIYDDSGSDMRIMRLQGGWNADGSVYADDGGIGTTIQGDTSGVTMSIVVSGSVVQLFATVTSGTWTITGTRKYVPNNGSGIVNPTSLANGTIWVGNVSNTPTAVTVTGDISLSNAGVAAISTGVIVNADISASAAIALTKLATLTASKAVVSDGSGFLTTSATTATQIGYLSTVTSDVQVQLDSKLSAATGAISTVVSVDLVANRAVIANPLGKIAASNVTSTEVGHLSGVTSAIQTQLNGKVNDTGDVITGTLEIQGGIRTKSSGPYLKIEVIEIVDWSIMSSISKSVPHGLVYSKIRGILDIMIRDDSDTIRLSNTSLYALQDTPRHIGTDATNINISGTTALQTTDWDSTGGFVRGWITVLVEA